MPTFAMKVYDLQWFTTFGMDYDQAAEALVEDGIDVVLTQNHIDPLPTSGVDQHEYLTPIATAFAVAVGAGSRQHWASQCQRATQPARRALSWLSTAQIGPTGGAGSSPTSCGACGKLARRTPTAHASC